MRPTEKSLSLVRIEPKLPSLYPSPYQLSYLDSLAKYLENNEEGRLPSISLIVIPFMKSKP
jgi:predicted transposase YdaD